MRLSFLGFIVGAVVAVAMSEQKAEARAKHVNSESAQEFKKQMYTTDIFFGENFKLTPHTTEFPFEILSGSPIFDHLVKNQLAVTVYNSCMARVAKNATIMETGEALTAEQCISAAVAVKQLPLEHYVRASASDALANWVYRVDGDNWYNFDCLVRETSKYLDKHDRELFVLRGFSPYSVLVDLLSTEDLPVVLDRAESTITLWTLELAD